MTPGRPVPRVRPSPIGRSVRVGPSESVRPSRSVRVSSSESVRPSRSVRVESVRSSGPCVLRRGGRRPGCGRRPGGAAAWSRGRTRSGERPRGSGRKGHTHTPWPGRITRFNTTQSVPYLEFRCGVLSPTRHTHTPWPGRDQRGRRVPRRVRSDAGGGHEIRGRDQRGRHPGPALHQGAPALNLRPGSDLRAP